MEEEDQPFGEELDESGKNEKKNIFKTIRKKGLEIFHAVKWVLLVVGVFFVLAVIASWNMNRNQTYSKQELQQIKSLTLYAAKSAEEAERIGRDDPLQALLHANYAVCYINAAKHMVNEQTIENLMGADMNELEQYLTQLQETLLGSVEQRLAMQKEKMVQAFKQKEIRSKPPPARERLQQRTPINVRPV